MAMKICPKCGASHGPRKALCTCGHDFFAKKKSQEFEIPLIRAGNAEPTNEDNVPQMVQRYDGRMTIYAPAGECPYKLTDTSPEAVLAWADKVQAHFRNQGHRISTDGLLYYARRIFDFNSPEFRDVKELLIENTV